MIKLFTTDSCPKCSILKDRLNSKKIEFEIGDNEEIIEAGFRNVPILKIDGEYMGFADSVEWVNGYGK